MDDPVAKSRGVSPRQSPPDEGIPIPEECRARRTPSRSGAPPALRQRHEAGLHRSHL